MRHVVRKQIIELKLNDRQSAFQVQSQVSGFYWKKIIPELEKLFDLLSDGKEIIQLDRLEIELGVLHAGQLESSQSLGDLCPGIISRIKEAIQAQEKKKHLPEPQSAAAQWLYYMEHGYLNWNTFVVDTAWNQKVLEAFATDYISVSLLRKLIETSSRARHRIATHHNETFLQKLTEVLTAKKQEDLIVFINELQEVLDRFGTLKKKAPNTPPVLRKKIWEKIISIAASGKTKSAPGDIGGKIISWLVKKGTEMTWIRISSELSGTYLRKLLLENRNRRKAKKQDGGNEESKKNFDKQTGKYNEASVDSNESPERQKQSLSGESIQGDEGITNDVMKKILKQKKDTSPESGAQDIDEGIFVDFAGLVLLHPFFSGLFKRLELTLDGRFVNDQAHQRSLYILYYLATGNGEAEEYELLMAKFLLGFPLNEIVPGPVVLTEKEKEEVDYLLEAAIEQWSILKATSIETFRQGFLQRKGKLYTKNDMYYLQVETGSIDMLLDHLPWNLSIIKLPWMKEILRVEWR